MTTIKSRLATALAKVTKDFTKEKRRAAGSSRDYISQEQYERWEYKHLDKPKIRRAAYEVMEEAYNKASDNGAYPANARQIMYAARPLIMAKTGNTIWKNDSYFTQMLLPNYMESHPETSEWDVVFDARGHFAEPHVRESLGIGTLEVRNYVHSWRESIEAEPDVTIGELYPTKGPQNRYRFALFVEKEGFDPLLEKAEIASRFDLAIFSSKGMSTTATRLLVERLSREGVTILVVHDFDKAGLGIMHTLGHDTRRYAFGTEPNVVDLGLRLTDVNALDLSPEPVSYGQWKNPGHVLESYGATPEEIAFLVSERSGHGWIGQRVELNALTAGQLVRWLEGKLKEHGVEKVVPERAVLESAYHRAKNVKRMQEALDDIKDEPDKSKVPANLEAQLRKVMKETPKLSWDQAILKILED